MLLNKKKFARSLIMAQGIGKCWLLLWFAAGKVYNKEDFFNASRFSYCNYFIFLIMS